MRCDWPAERRTDSNWPVKGTSDGRSVISGLRLPGGAGALAEYQDPDDLRVLFSEIYEPDWSRGLMRASRPYTYLGTVQGMCRECRALVPARVLEEDGAVYQERLCPRCGSARARMADDVEWYLARAATTVRCKPACCRARRCTSGCPQDCGPCAVHANACHLPVFSVTNACNMDCPICFTYNRADQKYFMSRAELRVAAGQADRARRAAGPDQHHRRRADPASGHPRTCCRNASGRRSAASP